MGCYIFFCNIPTITNWVASSIGSGVAGSIGSGSVWRSTYPSGTGLESHGRPRKAKTCYWVLQKNPLRISIGLLLFKVWERKPIYHVWGCKDNIPPIWFWNLPLEKKSSCSVEFILIFSLTYSRCLVNDSLWLKIGRQGLVEVISCIVSY